MSDPENDEEAGHPDLQHELPEHAGESTTDPADVTPPEGYEIEPEPGELPEEIPG